MRRFAFSIVTAGLMAGTVHAQEVRKVNPPTVAAPPAGAFSHVAEVPPGMRMLYLAGQVGNRLDDSVPATIEEQAVQALENIRQILAAEGARPQDVVKLTVYAAAKPTDMAKIRAKRAELFGHAPPPSTWLYVSGLASPQYLIEMDVVAAVPLRAK